MIWAAFIVVSFWLFCGFILFVRAIRSWQAPRIQLARGLPTTEHLALVAM